MGISSLVFCADLGFPEENDVIVADERNWDLILRSFDYLFCAFYAFSYGSWGKIGPNWQKTAEHYRDTDSQFVMAQMNIDENPEMRNKLDVTPNPMFKMYIRGKSYTYLGARTVEGFQEFMFKVEGRRTRNLFELEAYQEFIQKNDVSVLFFGHAEEGTEYNEFLYASMTYTDDAVFAHSTDPEVMEAFNVTKIPTIVMFENFGENRTEFYHDFQWDEKWIKDFVDFNKYDVVFDHGREIDRKTFDEKVPSIMLLVNHNEESKHARRAFREAHSVLKGRILMVKTYYKDEDAPHILQYHKNDDDYPGIIISSYYRHYRLKYIMPKEVKVTAENIIKFYWSWFNKEIDPLTRETLKSRPADMDRDPDHPFKVTIKRFRWVLSYFWV